jgi:myo-inositol-1(or 4)-monophosphatase
MTPEFEADAGLLEAALREAGDLAARLFRTGVKSWQKSSHDVVSEADIAVDRLLYERLKRPRPRYGWLSEESAPEKITGAPFWAVDPIDGTIAFIRARPEFSISVALVAKLRPVLAGVFNPVTNEFFAAQQAKGAYCNGAMLRAQEVKAGRPLKLLASRRTFERHGWLAALKDAEFHSVYSIAYRMALVAAGRYDAAISLSEKSDWDIAAADLIVAEAGGLCTAPNGEPLLYGQGHSHKGALAAHPTVHAKLLALIADRSG